MEWLKRSATMAAAGVGLLLVGVLGLGIFADTLVGIWNARGQLVLVGAGALAVAMVVLITRKRHP